MGGEGRAALAHDAGVLDDLHQLLGGQTVGVCHRFDFLGHFVLEVVLDDHGHHLAAHVEGAGLHGFHRAGDAGVDGCGNKSAGFADPLSNFYLVAHRNDRLARRTDVHRHGNDHLSRRCQLFDGLFIGRGLHVVRMNAAKESLCHCLHLILLPGGPLPPHTIQILQQNFSLVQSYGAIPVVFCRFYRGLDGVSREISPHFPASAKKSAVPAALRRPLCFRRRCVRILAHRGRNTFGPRAERMGHHAS